jgi:hypothetical protein
MDARVRRDGACRHESYEYGPTVSAVVLSHLKEERISCLPCSRSRQL